MIGRKKEISMNRIFKVVWSASKQCYVVASELATNTRGKKKIMVATVLVALVMGGVLTSWGRNNSYCRQS